jgi:hypothetical protein
LKLIGIRSIYGNLHERFLQKQKFFLTFFFWGGMGSVEKGDGLRVDFEEGSTSRTTEMCVVFVWATTQGDFVE